MPGEDSHDLSGRKRRIDVQSRASTLKGAGGLFETLLRRFRSTVHALVLLPLYAIASVCLGLALAPGLLAFQFVSDLTSGAAPWLRYPALSISIAAGYYLYGFTLILVVPLANFVLRGRAIAWRGPYYSLHCVRWYIHNGLTYLARYTFLEMITPTPFNLLFYRLMGMKIGSDVQINTSNISDPSLIELGDRVTIGGSATLLAHYGMGGYLVISPLKIGAGATIGLKATIMGGVEIGAGARILPNSVVLPRTKIPAGETWGGVPAVRIDIRKAA